MKKFKTGVASFYIVAFSTLLLTIIAVSFAAVILSEFSRSSRNDVSQSAYDSALAGIEDAKAAYLNYRNCINQGYTAAKQINANGPLTCGEIISYMERSGEGIGNECDTVGHILGHIKKTEDKETIIQEGSTDNEMRQAYTCVKMTSVLDDYRSQLSTDSRSRLIRVKVSDEKGVAVNDVKSIRLSWYSDADGTKLNYANFSNNSIVFPRLSQSSVAVPPAVSIQLFQTASTFNLEDLEETTGTSTDRGTIYLVPTGNTDDASSSSHNKRSDGFLGAWTHDEGNSTADDNRIGADAFIKSNDRTATNVPYSVYCPENSGKEFACSTSITLPTPIGGDRNGDTFMFVVSIPYGQPDTDFALELCNASYCSSTSFSEYVTTDASNDKIQFSGVQIGVDSTGRADILFRRVEARIDTSDIYFPHPEYAIQLLGGGDATLEKAFYVTSEYGRYN